MKKFISSILCFLMIFSMSTTTFAAGITTDGDSQETLVTYGMSQGFVVTIPANFIIDGDNKTATANVTASNVMIAHNSKLQVVITGDDYVDKWELIDAVEANNTLTYTIGSTERGTDIVNESVVLGIEAGEAYNTTVTKTLYFTIIGETTKAGSYSDTLTFTVGVIEGASDIVSEKISFTVDGNTYEVIENTTWEEWINSTNSPFAIAGVSIKDIASDSYVIYNDGNNVAASDIITATDYFLKIRFVVDNTMYVGTKGETWGEWLEGIYNKNNFKLNSSDQVLTSNGAPVYSAGYVPVYANDVINHGGNYIL